MILVFCVLFLVLVTFSLVSISQVIG